MATLTPPAGWVVPEAKPARHHNKLKWAVLGTGVFIALAAVGSLAPQAPAPAASLAPAAVVAAIPSATSTVTPSVTVTPTQTPEPTATPSPTPQPTPDPTPVPTAKPAPLTFGTLTNRSWALLVKAPDNYAGKGYKVWACITQFDAATGTDTFRADASYANQKANYFMSADNSMFTGSESQFAPFVKDDIVSMNVVSLGSYSYDTQVGGNTTVPMFAVYDIVQKGSCAP